MADKKVTQLTALTAPANNDILLIVDDPSGAPVSKKITIENLLGNTTRLTIASANVASNSTFTLAAEDFVFDANVSTTFTRGLVINEDGADSDTRIESDNSANALFVDASTDRVGVLCNDPNTAIDINSNSIRIRTSSTPASSSDAWKAGTIRWDTNYIYVAVADGTIKRASLLTF
ncbi:hypothetical protein EB118_17450 [bacterium]|nr:hypothetical protein [bacterium]NDG31844.1 hypothetical protein [bacterium]